MTRPEISVIVPVRDGRPHLDRQLESLANQEVARAWEVILVDNGSTDGSQDTAARFSSRLPNLRILEEQQPGKAHALNRGIAAAEGDLLIFLDQDDEIAPGYIDAMADGLTEYDLVGAKVDLDSINPPWARYQGGQTERLCRRKGCPDFSIGAALGARATAARTIEFDPDVGAADDIDFCWRAHFQGYTIGFVPDALLRYRQRDGERAAFRQGYTYGWAEVLLYLRYHEQGFARPGPRVVLWTLKSLAGLAIRSATRANRLKLCYWSGIVAGNLAGSLRWRVLYF